MYIIFRYFSYLRYRCVILTILNAISCISTQEYKEENSSNREFKTLVKVALYSRILL